MATFYKGPMTASILYPKDIGNAITTSFYMSSGQTYEPWIYCTNNSTGNVVLEIEIDMAMSSADYLSPRITVPPGTSLIWPGIAISGASGGPFVVRFISHTSGAPDTGKFTVYGYFNRIA